MDSTNLSRRTFIKNTAAVNRRRHAPPARPQGQVGAAASTSPNEKLRIGFIGVGGRAQEHLKSAIKLQNEGQVEVVAVCDVFNRHRKEAADRIKNGTKDKPKQIADYRELLTDKTIDAVCIATPDHWHAKQTMDAFKAGKHVYCEKPMTHSVEEAIAVYHAWKNSGQVMQVGVQSTSLPVWKDVRKPPLRGPTRQSADVPDIVLPQFRCRPVAILRSHERHDAQEHRLEDVPRH